MKGRYQLNSWLKFIRYIPSTSLGDYQSARTD